ncbi:TetR/AcrR family transcriptional regulator [Kribbella yunnanensis]|uniref:TetR/AcrR family transcriptional regulator n=1 Tax=Kribbella yunnanensis TaxID=190194 RepID=A0ABN2IK92_9ACTN
MVERKRDGAQTSVEIRQAAADLFFEHGYEATSLRAVADRVGIKVGSLYNHMGGKDELLVDIMSTVLDRLHAELDEAVAGAGDEPIARLKAVIGAHIRFHARHARETFIGNSELRSLPKEHRQTILQRRRDYEERMRLFIEDAADAAGVELLDARLQSYAVIALGTHVASWFKLRGDVTLDRVVEVYTELSLRQLGLTEADLSPNTVGALGA